MSNLPNRQEGNIHDTQPPSAAAPQLPTFFLRTKLLPPRPAPSLLPRPRLVERLEQNLADADPLVFLGYVTHGIQRIVPGFGEATMSYMQEASKELAQAPERAVDVLLNEVLDRVEQQFILVLDDYHHLGTETPVHKVVDRLLAYLPDLIHVVIISRDMPPLALARMRTQANLAVIDRQELLFTDEETRELFRSVFDLELTPEQLSEYRERTHGWITALQLVRQVAQRQALARGGEAAAAPPHLLEVLRPSGRDIFDYFRAEQGRQGLASEHARLADFFLEREQWEQAMHHLVAAEDFGRAAQTVAERGGAWVTAGALSS